MHNGKSKMQGVDTVGGVISSCCICAQSAAWHEGTHDKGYFVYYAEPNMDHPADRSVSPPLRCRQPGYYDVDPPGYSDVDAPGYSDVDSPEETRFELASSMDIISRAPFAGSFALWCGDCGLLCIP
nr:hypothetical protein [Tanacetum cinerariifolium]